MVISAWKYFGNFGAICRIAFVASFTGTVKNMRHCSWLMPQEQNWFGKGLNPAPESPGTCPSNGAIPCPTVKLVNGSLITLVGSFHGSNVQGILPEYWNFTSVRTFSPRPEIVATTLQPEVRYYTTPSPGQTNVVLGVVGFVGDTTFSVGRGFYTNPFPVTIATNTPGATIRYTTNGSEPSATNGAVYSGPITVSGTTVSETAL